MSVQLSQFGPGLGFVLHKVKIGRTLYSAWFNAAGELTGCEATQRGYRTLENGAAVPARAVKVRAELQRAGRHYANRIHWQTQPAA